jgi:anion-transporting  ArsA/GET3 family ATPase
MFLNNISQKLLFIVGKGGVGRTTISTSLACYFAQKGEKVLVVQWSLNDTISPLFSLPQCSHKESALPCGFSVMNFSASEAIREYFVDHLKMRITYSLVIENRHVQRLIQAAPGIQELFFLGRLFWLLELAQSEKGYSYDRIIVDAPATGHGISLFGIAPAVAQLGMTGPLATECERVTNLLLDKNKTGIFVVTLPEELPVEECIESVPNIFNHLKRLPLAILVNQSINPCYFSDLNFKNESWYLNLKEKFQNQKSSIELDLIMNNLLKRNIMEKKLKNWAEKFSVEKNAELPIYYLPDVTLLHKIENHLSIIQTLTKIFANLV